MTTLAARNRETIQVQVGHTCGIWTVQWLEVHFASFLSYGFTTMAVINPPDQKETGKMHLCAVSRLLAILKCYLTLKKVNCTIVRTLWSPRCFVTHVNWVDCPTPMVIFFNGDTKPGSSKPVAKCGRWDKTKMWRIIQIIAVDWPSQSSRLFLRLLVEAEAVNNVSFKISSLRFHSGFFTWNFNS